MEWEDVRDDREVMRRYKILGRRKKVEGRRWRE
jgi:hypothetical protein